MTLTNRLVSIFPPSMAETLIIAKENGSRSILEKKKRILKSSFFYDLLKVKKYYTSEIIVGGSCVRDNCSGDNYLGGNYSAKGNLSCHRTSVIWHQAWTFFFWVHNFTNAPDRARKKKKKNEWAKSECSSGRETRLLAFIFDIFLLKVLAMRVL